MAGEVPLAPTTTLSVVVGYKTISYPYPAVAAFTNTALAKGSISGDELALWNNGWTVYVRGRSGWGAATNVQLQLGQAFMYKAGAARDVNEVKPYTID
jgi:phage gp29-like protein